MPEALDQPTSWAGLWEYAAETAGQEKVEAADFFRHLADLEDVSRDSIEARIVALSDDAVVSALAGATMFSLGLNSHDDLPETERFVSWLVRRLSTELQERTDDG